MKTFSVICPAYIYSKEKKEELLRAIHSIQRQEYDMDKIEMIVVNDGSPFQMKLPKFSWLRVINQPNLQRITAYQTGFKAAKNDVICMLDADDEYSPTYMNTVNKYYIENPEYEMFNFGNVYIHKDKQITLRGTFRPKMEKVGHEVFGGGNIVNGTYVFTRKILKELGAFPQNEIKDIDCTSINYPAGGNMVRDLTMCSPYDFSAWFQLRFPETQQFFMVNVDSEPNKIIKEIGNPFGQDYALFYKYTRKYHSKPMNDYLYICHPR